MGVATAVMLLVGQEAGAQDGYRRVEEPFKLAGFLLAVERVRTSFDDDLRVENAWGLTAEAHLRLGEIYYYRFGLSAWETDEELPVGEDVDLRAYTLGIGMDWLFGAFPNFSLDAGGSVGILRIASEHESDTGWMFQIDVAARLRITPNVGLRGTLLFDFPNVHFNTDETDHMTNVSVGAGLEIGF
jgi:hypothetical protein